MRWASSWAADRNFTNATDANRWPSQVIGAQVIAGMSVDKGARRTLTHDSAGKQTRSVLSIIEGISAVTLAGRPRMPVPCERRFTAPPDRMVRPASAQRR
jgi:hypothetical protein